MIALNSTATTITSWTQIQKDTATEDRDAVAETQRAVVAAAASTRPAP